jgi:hypothetical protein
VIELRGTGFETSSDEIIQRILKRIALEISSEPSLFILEKYRDVFKEVNFREGFTRTGREIGLNKNPFLRELNKAEVFEKEIVLSTHLEEHKEKLSSYLFCEGEPLGLLTFPTKSKVKGSHELDKGARNGSALFNQEIARRRRLQETEACLSIDFGSRNGNRFGRAVYRSLEIAREMLRVR